MKHALGNPDKTGERKAVIDGQDDPDHYLEQTIGDAPLYILGWEEHRVFVPDNNGGHYAYSSNGILYRMDYTGEGKMTPIAPVHDTNRTILSSSSVSLLKAAIKLTKSYPQRP
jgi:hypothetical protein